MVSIDEKAKLREYYMAVRKRLSSFDANMFSSRIAINVFSMLRLIDADNVLVYSKMGSEVSTENLIEMIIDSGRAVALPFYRSDGTWGVGRLFNPRQDAAIGPFGAMEPVDGLKGNICLEHIGSVICPGVAFDENGRRLGRGGGHYDRLLKRLKGEAFIIGCAFDCQICDSPLPVAEHDVDMDAVITESRAFPAGSCPALTGDAEISNRQNRG